MLLDNILPIMKGGVLIKIIKNNQKVIGLAKKLKTNQINISLN